MEEMGFPELPSDAQITKVSATPGCMGHIHANTTMYTAQALFYLFCGFIAYLDREDICSVSCVHGEQLLVV